jgi:hypothetical protein
MTGTADLDAILRGWLSEGAERAPSERVQAALEATASMRQRTGSFLGFPMRRSDVTSPSSHLRAVLLVAAAVTLLVGAGIGLAFQLDLVRIEPQPPDVLPFDASPPAVSASASPTAASDFVSESSLGTIVWERLESDEAIYVCCEIDGAVYGQALDSQTWWVIEDGAWVPAETPAFDGRATYIDAGEARIATVSPDGYSVMMGGASPRDVISYDPYNDPGEATAYRRDGTSWTPFELPPMAIEADGLRVGDPGFTAGAGLADGTWVVPVHQFAEVPWGEVLGQFEYPPDSGEMVDPWPVWDRADQVLDLVEPGGYPGSILASYDVALTNGTPPSIEFRNIETGEVVHSVPATLSGWTSEEMLTSLRGYGLHDVSLLIGKGDELTVVRPPWPPTEEFFDTGSIVAANGRLYATSLVIGEDNDATALHLWSSENGIDWDAVELPPPPRPTFEWIELIENNGTLLIFVHDDEGDWIWSSSDGSGWTMTELGAENFGSAVPTGFGWMSSSFDGSQMSVSRDGTSWELITPPPLPGEPSLSSMAGLLLFGPQLVEDRPITWVGHLDD